MNNNIDAITSLAHKSCAALNVQCLADSGITDWQTAFNQQIANAKRLGLMPDDFKVIRETLQNFGFAMQSTAVEGIRAGAALSMIGYSSVPSVVFLQLSDYQHLGGYMAAVHMDADKCVPVSSLASPDNFDKRWVNHIWIRWSDGIDRSPYPRKAVNRKARDSKRRSIPETACFKPFQPNPHDNYIGDCVVRATAGAMDITWNDALDALAAMQEVTINAREVYPRILEKYGFIHHNPLVCNGHRLDGKAFCEEMSRIYHNGERIFAHVGRLHVAAIVPVHGAEGNKTYKIIDSWDSSTRLIGEYWVLPANSHESKNDVPSSLSTGNQQPLSIGVRLKHPKFGVGIITEVVTGILTIDFGENGSRRLGETWVRKHCPIIEPGEDKKHKKIAQNERRKVQITYSSDMDF